jgi:putative Ca2+/H+ antiporter (TMEM165/GDT1 family)
MDLRVLLTTFGVIFLAEMGVKTQLAAMTMDAQPRDHGLFLSARRWRWLQSRRLV